MFPDIQNSMTSEEDVTYYADILKQLRDGIKDAIENSDKTDEEKVFAQGLCDTLTEMIDVQKELWDVLQALEATPPPSQEEENRLDRELEVGMKKLGEAQKKFVKLQADQTLTNVTETLGL